MIWVKRKKRGFTFLEVLISLMILSVVTVSVFAIFTQGLDVWRKAITDMNKYANARAFLDTISAELLGATIDPWGNLFFLGTNMSTGSTSPYSDDGDVLYFFSNVTTTATNSTHLAEISYWFTRTSALTGDINRYINTTGIDFSDSGYTPFANPAATAEAVAANIVGLNFEYWHTTNGNFGKSNWDSTNDSIADEYAKLPEAVRITVTIRDDFNRQNEDFSTVVYLPESEKYY